MKVSVITVCYEESEERIRLTGESVIGQSYPDVQWIVVDGGSGTNTLSVLNEYREHMSQMISEPDNGVYYAMNKGLALASGDLIVIMNIGDTFSESNTLSDVVERVLDNSQYEIYYGDAICVDENYSSAKLLIMPGVFSKRMLYDNMICHQAIFARKSLVSKVGYFNTNYQISADYDWLLRISKLGSKGLHMPINVCVHHAGLSENRDLRRAEYKIIRQEHFSSTEINIIKALKKIHGYLFAGFERVKTRNFTTPITIQNIVNRCRVFMGRPKRK